MCCLSMLCRYPVHAAAVAMFSHTVQLFVRATVGALSKGARYIRRAAGLAQLCWHGFFNTAVRGSASTQGHSIASWQAVLLLSSFNLVSQVPGLYYMAVAGFTFAA
jgi:hypothetical protein